MDRLAADVRSALMAKIRGRNTSPELLVRRLLFSLGYRYRLHYKRLPGKPDIAFPGRLKVVFVHGCFWHNHSCSRGTVPKTRIDFWQAKLCGNRERDAKNRRDLKRRGWSVLVLWECQLKNPEALAARLEKFLNE